MPTSDQHPAREILIDVSALPPCEPLELILAALEEITVGEYIRMRHRREPLLLYPILAERGFRHHTHPHGEDDFTILIWRAGDAVAEAGAKSLSNGYQP